MSKIKKVAVIGTGVIGVGWTIRLLAHNIKVLAYDKNLIQRNKFCLLYKYDAADDLL